MLPGSKAAPATAAAAADMDTRYCNTAAAAISAVARSAGQGSTAVCQPAVKPAGLAAAAAAAATATTAAAAAKYTLQHHSSSSVRAAIAATCAGQLAACG